MLAPWCLYNFVRREVLHVKLQKGKYLVWDLLIQVKCREGLFKVRLHLLTVISCSNV